MFANIFPIAGLSPFIAIFPLVLWYHMLSPNQGQGVLVPESQVTAGHILFSTDLYPFIQPFSLLVP